MIPSFLAGNRRWLLVALLVLASLAFAGPAGAAGDPPTCNWTNGDAEVGQEEAGGGCFDFTATDTVHVTITQQPGKGTVTVQGQDTPFPSVRYTASSTGSDTFKFKGNDGTSDSNEVTATTNNVAAHNDAPVCFSGFAGGNVEVGDTGTAGACSDEEHDNLHITITEVPTKGTATVVGQDSPNASVNYTAEQTGADELKFKANDGSLDSNEVTVSSNNVTAQNDPPLCGASSGGDVEVGQTVSVGGCFDDEQGNLTITITEDPTKGTAAVVNQGTPNASVTYTASQTGTDSFKFKANDGTSDSNVVTVNTNNIPPQNDPPQCGGGFPGDAEVGEAKSVGGCSDEESDTIHITITQDPTKGTATVVNQDSEFPSVQYTASQTGSDIVKFKGNDGNSDSTEVTVNTNNVPAQNDPPQCFSTAFGTGGVVQAEVGEPTSAAACSDEERDNIHITITQQGTKGTATVANQDSAFASVQYTASQTGSDTFKLKGNDGTNDSNELTVSTNNSPAQNDPPQCFPSGVGNLDAEVGEATFAGNCNDPEGDNIHITITQQGTKGTATVVDQDSEFASVQYTASQTGPDTFKFKGNDGTNDSNVVTVTTNNTPTVDDPPECTGATGANVQVGQTESVGGCSDPEGQNIHITVTQAAGKGTATVVDQDTPDASVDYQATATGADTFKFKGNDGTNDSNVVTVTTNNTPAGTTNHAPVCSSTTASLTVGGDRDFTCTDSDGNTLSYIVDGQPARGTATVVTVGGVKKVRYHATSAGSDTLRFHANDGTANSGVATITITNSAASTGGGGGGGTGGNGGGNNGAGGVLGQTQQSPAKAGLPGSKTASVGAKGVFVYGFNATPGLSGQATFETAGKVKISKSKRVRIGKKSFTVPASGKVKLKIKLSRKNLRLLRKKRKLKLRVTVIIKNGAGSSQVTSKLTIKAPKKKKKK